MWQNDLKTICKNFVHFPANFELKTVWLVNEKNQPQSIGLPTNYQQTANAKIKQIMKVVWNWDITTAYDVYAITNRCENLLSWMMQTFDTMTYHCLIFKTT